MNSNVLKETWWLADTEFPDLLWARIQVYEDGTAEMLSATGYRYKYKSEEEANSELFQDDYLPFHSLDEEDEEELGIPLSSIQIPSGESDDEIIQKMYVKRSLL
ncbi:MULTISPECIES: hypothetical protein [unclassified Roseofilum]|uniref:hypothetical protein n=1 Tax=unclassified Roseofilum TaxID=2620099 RepID=UPI000E8FE06A|nr:MULTISPECIES: hypothetical protein [unclassified Roseofilum]MBP0009547.1 hypothetical protein [Roseofilum sp. Belize Diploria]MBP0032722.1 hypothetical protein [Roseofilum sp. Belize BBD 4]HBQ98865.1 hypothetical protein [Cyanobacteria bacterium UBA11691]